MNTLEALGTELSSDQLETVDGGFWPIVIFALYAVVGYGVGRAIGG